MPEFSVQKRIRYEHCDAAGIAFYPRYVEIVHQVFEDWFEEGLGINYRRFHVDENRAIPLVDMRCRFFAPSYLSERLHFTLGVAQLGKRSASILIRGSCNGERRLEAELNVVHCQGGDGAIKSTDIPEDMAARMRTFLIEEESATRTP